MPLFRRAAQDPERKRSLAAFRATLTHVDAAQRALLSAVPTSRDAGRPLEQAVDEFQEHLHAAVQTMTDWPGGQTAHEWTKCAQSIAQSLLAVTSLRGAELGFEALNARIGEVLAPLEAFGDVASALRRSG